MIVESSYRALTKDGNGQINPHFAVDADFCSMLPEFFGTAKPQRHVGASQMNKLGLSWAKLRESWGLRLGVEVQVQICSLKLQLEVAV